MTRIRHSNGLAPRQQLSTVQSFTSPSSDVECMVGLGGWSRFKFSIPFEFLHVTKEIQRIRQVWLTYAFLQNGSAEDIALCFFPSVIPFGGTQIASVPAFIVSGFFLISLWLNFILKMKKSVYRLQLSIFRIVCWAQQR